jgi:hypothetical protein
MIVRKAILTLTAIAIILIMVNLTSSKLNQTPITEMQKSTETFNQNVEAAEREATHENQIANEGEETTTQASQNPNTQCQAEENNQQTNPTSENPQTLENQKQDENITPPDGRIYYPTSSEQPYAYTPTHTPKETNIPLTLIENYSNAMAHR